MKQMKEYNDILVQELGIRPPHHTPSATDMDTDKKVTLSGFLMSSMELMQPKVVFSS